MLQIVLSLGESDCEQIGAGLLAQPVNAISSLMFSVFGLVVLLSTFGRGRSDRQSRYVFGTLMIATGIGSFLFHGPQGPASHFLHDVTFLITVFMIAILNLSGVLGWASTRLLAVSTSVIGAVFIVLLLVPSSTNVLAGLALIAVVTVDVVVRRRASMNTRWWLGAITLMALALAAFLVGRTDGPLCDSTSLLQGHALWHALSAAALWAYFESSTSVRTTGER